MLIYALIVAGLMCLGRWAKRLSNLKILSGIIVLGLCTCASENKLISKRY